MTKKSILILSISFAFIFFGFNGVQQYVTVYFDQLGVRYIGFVSLLLIYLFFGLFSPLALPIMNRLGMVRTMIIGAAVYGLFIYSLLISSVGLIIVSSCMLGIAAGLLWTSQGSYLLRSSQTGSYGQSAGLFTMIWAFGAALGMVLFGFVSKLFGYFPTLLIWGSVPFAGGILLFFLPRVEIVESQKKEVGRLDSRVVRLGIVNFMFMFMFGLVIGSIPLLLTHSFSIEVVGILGSLFFVASVLFSYVSGKLSDIFGRKILLLWGLVFCLFGLLFLSLNLKWMLFIGVICVSLTYAIVRPIILAVAGDFGQMEQNVAYFNVFQCAGVVCALLIGLFVSGVMVFYVSLGVVVGGSLFVVSEVRKLK